MKSKIYQSDILLYIALSEEFNDLFDELIDKPGKKFNPIELKGIAITIFSGEIYSPSKNKNYVVTIVPAGKMGCTRAASVLAHIIPITNVRNIVVLGISGSISNDLQPGDVFIPDSVNEYLANSSTKSKGESWVFETSGNHLPTSPRLLNRFQNFRITQRDIYDAWLNDCSERTSPLLKGEIKEQLLKRNIDLRDEVILISGEDKILASGPAVGKGEVFLDWLKGSDRKIAAMEMESGGAYDAAHIHTPSPRTMAIRGISDFADERKNLIEEVTNGKFRAASLKNAFSLFIKGVEAGFFEPDKEENKENVIDVPDLGIKSNSTPSSLLVNTDKVNTIFLHFMDHHYLESISVGAGWKRTVDEASFGMRLALSLANEVLVPASSYVESKLCRTIVNKYRNIFSTGKLKLVGSGASYSDYCESSLYQYNKHPERYQQYRNAKRLHSPPFKSRRVSATKEIVSHWLSSESDYQREAIYKAYYRITGKIVPDNKWEDVPNILENTAFIVDHVLPIFYEKTEKDPPSILTNSMHLPINSAYFNSFYSEFNCGGMINMNYLNDPFGMSFKYSGPCIDYLNAYNTLFNNNGLLMRFTNFSSSELVSAVDVNSEFGILCDSIVRNIKKELTSDE